MFRLWAALGFRVRVWVLGGFFVLIWGFRRFRVKYGDCAVWIKGLGVFRIAAKGVGCWTKTIIEILVHSGEQVLFFSSSPSFRSSNLQASSESVSGALGSEL